MLYSLQVNISLADEIRTTLGYPVERNQLKKKSVFWVLSALLSPLGDLKQLWNVSCIKKTSIPWETRNLTSEHWAACFLFRNDEKSVCLVYLCLFCFSSICSMCQALFAVRAEPVSWQGSTHITITSLTTLWRETAVVSLGRRSKNQILSQQFSDQCVVIKRFLQGNT